MDEQTIVGFLAGLAGFAIAAAAFFGQEFAAAKKSIEMNVDRLGVALRDFLDSVHGSSQQIPDDKLHQGLQSVIGVHATNGSSGVRPLEFLASLPAPPRRLDALLIGAVVSALPASPHSGTFLSNSKSVNQLRVRLMSGDLAAAGTIFNEEFVPPITAAIADLDEGLYNSANEAAAAAQKIYSLRGTLLLVATLAAALTAFCVAIIGHTAGGGYDPSAGALACLDARPRFHALQIVTLVLLAVLGWIAAAGFKRLWDARQPISRGNSLHDTLYGVLGREDAPVGSLIVSGATAIVSIIFILYIEAMNPFLHGLVQCS